MDLIIPFICLLFYATQNSLEMCVVLILNPQQNWEMLLKGLGSKQDGLSSAFGKERMLKASNAARGD